LTHELLAVVVKASDEAEAEEKGWKFLKWMCEPSIIEHEDGQLEEIYLYSDWGVIVNSEYDRVHNVSRYRHIEEAKIASVTSPSAKDLIKGLYDLDLGYVFATGKYGYHVLDEECNSIFNQYDPRLDSSEYFVVPLDVHS
jgi:hypothetical protein